MDTDTAYIILTITQILEFNDKAFKTSNVTTQQLFKYVSSYPL